MARILRRLLFLAAYFGYIKSTMTRNVKTKSLGFSLVVPPTVFHPRYYFTSKFLGEHVSALDLNGRHVMDLGCGSGILSLAAARSGAYVVSVDINPAAVEATRTNADRNGLHRTIRAVESDMFAGLDPTGARFDLILCNPPFYEGEPTTMTERAFKGGDRNRFMTRFACSCSPYLRQGGSVVLVLSSDADVEACLRPFLETGFTSRVVEEKKLLFERLIIIELLQI